MADPLRGAAEKETVVHSMDQLARQPKLLKDYAPPDYLIETVELDFALDPKATRVKSKLLLRPNPKAAPGDRPLVLDGEGLVLQSLALDGRPLGLDDYRLGEKSLTIPKVPARPFTLEIVTLCDPEANTALSGLYRSRDTYCTQCEPEGFRRITYFIDRPDALAVYTVRIEADAASAPVLLSNGNPVSARRSFPAREGISRFGTIPIPSRLICSRWSAAISRACRTASPPRRAARSRSISTSSPARKTVAAGPWSP